MKVQRKRSEYLGSADMATIMGINPWQTRSELYLSKVEGVDKEENEAMKWGRLLEPVIIDELCRLKEIPNYSMQVHVRHEKYDFIAGTADAITPAKLIEIKTTNEFSHRKWQDEIPLNVQIQCQFLMGLTSLPEALIGVLVAGQKLRDYKLEFDQCLYNRIVIEAVKFWENHIIPRIQPEDF